MKKIICLMCILSVFFFPMKTFAYSLGIDVSHNNSGIDFVSLKSEGKEFAMIRLGYYNHLDEKFWDNVKACCDAGIEYGVYLYSYAFNEEEAKIEADFVLSTISSLGDYSKFFTLPVAYDLEDEQLILCGKAQITKNLNVFCRAIQNSGYVPMIYANLEWFKNYIDIYAVYRNGWKLWYAKWESKPDLTVKKEIGETGIFADVWQYASSDLDLNVAYDLASLKKIDISQAVISGVKDKAYTGKAVKQKITVKLGGKKLIKGKDYSVSYSANKGVGKASLIVKGKGLYSGKLSKSFKINPQKSKIVKVSKNKNQISVKWKKISKVTGYKIQYSEKSNFKNAKSITVKGDKNTNALIKKGKSKRKYYVRIRTYKIVNGKKYYSAWSSKKKV